MNASTATKLREAMPWMLGAPHKPEAGLAGIQVDLQPGWCFGADGFHVLHELNVTELLAAAQFVKPCECDLCAVLVQES